MGCDGGGGGARPSLQVKPPTPSSTWVYSLANVPVLAAKHLCGRGGPGDVAFLLKFLPGLECSPHLAAF